MKKSIILISLFLMLSVLAYSHTLGLGLYIPLGEVFLVYTKPII